MKTVRLLVGGYAALAVIFAFSLFSVTGAAGSDWLIALYYCFNAVAFILILLGATHWLESKKINSILAIFLGFILAGVSVLVTFIVSLQLSF